MFFMIGSMQPVSQMIFWMDGSESSSFMRMRTHPRRRMNFIVAFVSATIVLWKYVFVRFWNSSRSFSLLVFLKLLLRLWALASAGCRCTMDVCGSASMCWKRTFFSVSFHTRGCCTKALAANEIRYGGGDEVGTLLIRLFGGSTYLKTRRRLVFGRVIPTLCTRSSIASPT